MSYNFGVDLWKGIGYVVFWNFFVLLSLEVLEFLIGFSFLFYRNSIFEIVGYVAWFIGIY